MDIESQVPHVARLKGGLSTMHPLRGEELRAISAWLKDRARMKPTVKTCFISEQRKPLLVYFAAFKRHIGFYPVRPDPENCEVQSKADVVEGEIPLIASTEKPFRRGE